MHTHVVLLYAHVQVVILDTWQDFLSEFIVHEYAQCIFTSYIFFYIIMCVSLGQIVIEGNCSKKTANFALLTHY